MKNKIKIFFVTLLHSFVFAQALSFLLLFVSFSFQSYEKAAFRNASEYASKNNPVPVMCFKYTPNTTMVGEKTLSIINPLIDEIDGSNKFYNYGNMFGVSPEASIMIDGKTQHFRFADTSYLPNNPSNATNLLQLSGSITKYDEAFDEKKDCLYIDGDSLTLGKNSFFSLDCYFGSTLLESSDAVWSSSDSSIVNIASNGVVEGVNSGVATIQAIYEGQAASIVVNVDETSNSASLKKSYPVVVPYAFALSLNEDCNQSIGKCFNATIGGCEYSFKVGAYYTNDAGTPYRNSFIHENFGDYIYFLRSSRYYLPINEYYLLVGTKDIANMGLYNDLFFIKQHCKLNFELPKDMPINQVRLETKGNLLLWEALDSIFGAAQYKLVTIGFGVSSTIMFVLSTLLLISFKEIKKWVPVSSLLIGVGLPLLFFYLKNTFAVNGITFFIFNNVAGWILIIVSIVLVGALFYQLLRFDKKKRIETKEFNDTIVPVVNGIKKCIYIGKGAYLPNQNASALRIESISNSLIEQDYGFHIIGISNYPKYSITKINENCYIHSIYDKTKKNGVIEKIKSFYFVTDLIYKIVVRIIKSNKIDYIFVYQTIPSSLSSALIRLCKKQKIQLIFDMVEYQTLSQQKNLPGILFNYLPSRRIINHYIKKGKAIAISSYLDSYFKENGVRSLLVPFFFDTSMLKNSKYRGSNIIRIIYAGAPFGSRDTIVNAVRGFNLLSDELKEKFEFTFIGVTREDMKTLSLSESDLFLSDKHFTYLGRQPHEKVIELYSKSDYSLLLKPAEKRFSKAGFPTKVSESWSLSTPVIANLSGDMHLFMKDMYNGVVCDSDSPEDFKNALIRVSEISKEDYLAMRKNSRKTAKEKLDKKVYAKQIKEFIEND